MLGQDLAQLCQGLFAAIFLVTRNEHDVFAESGALLAFVNHPGIVRPRLDDEEAD